MRTRYVRILALLTAAATGTLLDISCTTGEPADTGDHCWFICKSIVESQAALSPDASVLVAERSF